MTGSTGDIRLMQTQLLRCRIDARIDLYNTVILVHALHRYLRSAESVTGKLHLVSPLKVIRPVVQHIPVLVLQLLAHLDIRDECPSYKVVNAEPFPAQINICAPMCLQKILPVQIDDIALAADAIFPIEPLDMAYTESEDIDFLTFHNCSLTIAP